MSYKENIESGMGELSLRKCKDRKGKRKRIVAAVIGIVTIFLIVGAALLIQRGHGKEQTAEKKEKVYSSLSAADRETADLYAELYEMDREQVAKIQAETKDWEQTGRKLEQDFFTIPENTKYQMEQEGYSLDDLEQAREIIEKYHLTEVCKVYISPVFGQIDPADIVDYMIEHHQNGVRLQLQLHKFIWDPQRRGV